MILRRFVPVYGGKRSIAAKYPVPQYNTIIEPFAGGAGYSVEHYERKVKLYDTDERVVAVWEYLIGASANDIRKIPVDIDHVDELPSKYVEDVRWLVGWWMQPAGAGGPAKRRSKWSEQHAGGGDNWGEKCRDRIAGQVDYIRHWTVEQRSYDTLDVRRKATWFVDPPYMVMGHHYRDSDIDYDWLGHWCHTLRGQAIVCENAGATWLPFEALCDLNGGAMKRTTKEVVWSR